jgi:hypothetical protein
MQPIAAIVMWQLRAATCSARPIIGLNMSRYRFHQRTAVTALLTVALASCGLTACGSSSDPAAQTRSYSPREAAIQKTRRRHLTELVSCARRHGIHLPPPTERGINVSGVKGRSREDAISACYQEVLKKAAREAGTKRAEQQAGPPTLGEESPSG